MIIETGFEQLSDEWFAAKAGIPSASHFSEIITPNGDPSKSQTPYMYRLAGEYIAGGAESYVSYDMKRGIELEPEAVKFFEYIHDVELEPVALCYFDERKDRLCSPDRLGLEIKCPKMQTHVGYLIKGVLPYIYLPQVQGSMYITGYDYWWFMSYYPGLPPFEIKVKRDERFISALAKELDGFVIKLAMTITKVKEVSDVTEI